MFVVLLSSNVIFRLSHADYCSESPQPFPTLLCLSKGDFKGLLFYGGGGNPEGDL